MEKDDNKKSREAAKESEPRRGKKETRDALLKAAMELFAEKGYRGTSVRTVAAKAGVTTGAFYSNFRSKRDIYIAIIEEITNTVNEMVDETTIEIINVMKSNSGLKMNKDLLYPPINRLLEEAYRHEAVMQIMRREGLGRDPEFQRDIDRVWDRLVRSARRALDMYIEAGFAHKYDTDLVARAMVSVAIAMSLHDVQTKGRRREDLVSLLAAMLHGGVTQWVHWQKEGAAP